MRTLKHNGSASVDVSRPGSQKHEVVVPINHTRKSKSDKRDSSESTSTDCLSSFDSDSNNGDCPKINDWAAELSWHSVTWSERVRENKLFNDEAENSAPTLGNACINAIKSSNSRQVVVVKYSIFLWISAPMDLSSCCALSAEAITRDCWRFTRECWSWKCAEVSHIERFSLSF